jgi:hypothetical protein
MLSALNVLNCENTVRQMLNIRSNLNIRGVVEHCDRGFESYLHDICSSLW